MVLQLGQRSNGTGIVRPFVINIQLTVTTTSNDMQDAQINESSSEDVMIIDHIERA